MARNGAELRTIMILPANSQNPRTIRALPRGIRVPRIPRPGLAAARRGMVRRLEVIPDVGAAHNLDPALTVWADVAVLATLRDGLRKSIST